MTPQCVHLANRAPWSILPEALLEWAEKFSYSVPANTKPGKNFFGDDLPQMVIRDNVATIPIRGTLLLNANYIERGAGAMDYHDISAWLDEAKATSGLKAVLLEVNSPGGSAVGVGELAAQIAGLAKSMPVYAFTESVAASAAYYLACGSRQIFTTPSAMLGSVGVILQAVDATKFFESMGLKIETFTTGKYKAAGNPIVPMNADFREYFQSRVNTLGDQFKSFVRSQRGIDDSMMEGQIVFGAHAVSARLADGVVGGLGEVRAMAAKGEKPYFEIELERQREQRNRKQTQTMAPDLREAERAFERAQAQGRVGRISAGRNHPCYSAEDFPKP